MTNYYTGQVAPKTRLDKPTLAQENRAYHDRYQAIMGVLQAFAEVQIMDDPA